MMKPDRRHIHALMTSWITGDITREEALYLKHLLGEDPAVKAEWTEFRQKFSQEDLDDAFNRYEQQAWIPAEEITGLVPLPQGKRIYRIVKRFIIAAAVITSAGLGWYIANRNTQQPRTQPIAATANSRAKPGEDIALQLASGQTINLSTAKDNILLENARLNNAGKTLSYTLLGTDG